MSTLWNSLWSRYPEVFDKGEYGNIIRYELASVCKGHPEISYDEYMKLGELATENGYKFYKEFADFIKNTVKPKLQNYYGFPSANIKNATIDVALSYIFLSSYDNDEYSFFENLNHRLEEKGCRDDIREYDLSHYNKYDGFHVELYDKCIDLYNEASELIGYPYDL